jgi:hypothetical protein
MKKLFFLPLLLITCFCLAQDTKEIIGKPVKIGNILVAEYDFPEYMNFEDAKKACRALGKGWRLPSVSESNMMYKRRDKIENKDDTFYWNLSGKLFVLAEIAGLSEEDMDKASKNSVRAVKSL